MKMMNSEKGYLLQILPSCTKINSKWLKDLNIRHDTIKPLEETIGKTFSDINHTNVSLGQSPKAIEIKTKINKLLHSKGNHKKTKTQKNEKTASEKIFANDGTDKSLISKIYKQFIQLNNKKNKQPNRKMGRRPQ